MGERKAASTMRLKPSTRRESRSACRASRKRSRRVEACDREEAPAGSELLAEPAHSASREPSRILNASLMAPPSPEEKEATESVAFTEEGRPRVVAFWEDRLEAYDLPAHGDLTIGRTQDCAIRIDHRSVSRQH